MLGSAEISPFHNAVAKKISEILSESVIIISPYEENWWRVKEGSCVNFDLYYQDITKREIALRGFRDQSKKSRVSVIPLLKTNAYISNFWVSWHETWRKENSKNYTLLNSGWTLFSGLQGQGKEQILRVEWDQLPYGNKKAGHPHWHFDHDIPILKQPEKIIVDQDLIEIAETPSEEMRKSIGYIHLAMGTWNEGKDNPECWQRTYEDDCRKLKDWCIKTLIYLKEQVENN